MKSIFYLFETPGRLHWIRSFSLLCFSFLLLIQASSFANRAYFESPVEGRWDLTLTKDGKSLPSWLEVRHSGTRFLVGQFVGMGGSSRPISKINFNNNILSFSIPPQWDTASNDLGFEARFQGDSLLGTLVMPDGTSYLHDRCPCTFVVENQGTGMGKTNQII